MDKVIESHWKKRRTKLIASTIVLAVVFILILNNLWLGGDSVSKEEIEISTVKKGIFIDKVNARGVVEPHLTYVLDASEGGRVEKVFVEEGAYVTKGQKVLELSNTDLQLNVMSREADVSEQLNFVRNTRIEMERRRLELENNLLDSSYNIATLEARIKRLEKQPEEFVSEEKIENLLRERDYQKAKYELAKGEIETEKKLREVQLKELEDSVESLETNLKIASEVLDKLNVIAQADGRLTVLNARIGESKSKGDNLGKIDDESSLKVVAKIDEFYLPQLRIGTKGSLSHQGEAYPISVTRIYPQVQSGQFRFDLAFQDRQPQSLILGQNFSITLFLNEVQDALILKKGDFYQESGGNWIFVVDPDTDEVTKRRISLSAQSDGFWLVESGLVIGELVITSSYEGFAKLDSFKLK